jgi:hypothetical protein
MAQSYFKVGCPEWSFLDPYRREIKVSCMNVMAGKIEGKTWQQTATNDMFNIP